MATTVNSGKDYQIRNIEVNSTSDTPIDFDRRFVSSVDIHCRSSVNLHLRENRDESVYFTIPSGTTYTLNVSARKNVICYIRSASSTPIVEVIGYIE